MITLIAVVGLVVTTLVWLNSRDSLHAARDRNADLTAKLRAEQTAHAETKRQHASLLEEANMAATNTAAVHAASIKLAKACEDLNALRRGAFELADKWDAQVKPDTFTTRCATDLRELLAPFGTEASV